MASVTHLLTFGDDVGANIMQYLGTREDIELQSLSQYFLRNYISKIAANLWEKQKKINKAGSKETERNDIKSTVKV